MKMKKIFFLTFIFSLWNITPSLAFLKIDAGGTAAEITKTVSNSVEKVKKKFEENATLQTIIAYGKGAAETAKQLQALKEDTEEKINAVKEDPLGAGLDLAAEGVDKLETVQGGKYAELAEKIDKKMTQAQELTDLEKQKENLEKSINEKIESKKTEVSGKIEVLQKNNANLEKMIEEDPDNAEEYKKQIESNNQKINTYQTALTTAEEGINAESLQELTDINGKLSDLKGKAQAELNKQKNAVEQALKDKLEDFDSEGKLKSATGNNFLADGEAETHQALAEKKAYRRVVAAQDTIDTIALAATTKQSMPDKSEESKKLADRSGAMDGQVSGLNMNTQVTAENVKSLATLIELTLAELKMQTSNEMRAMETISSAPDSDIANFSLDKYICDSEGE